MTRQRSSFYIKSEGPNKTAVVNGFQWLSELGKNDEEKRSALLAVPLKSNLQGVISSVIGEQATKAIAKDNRLQLADVKISLITQRDKVYSWDGPVLAIYPNKKLLDKIDDLSGVTDVLVIPWVPDEVEYWIDTWSAIELGATLSEEDTNMSLHPVVEAALKSLTVRVNLSTGVSHPRDRSATIELFKILRDAGIPYEPYDVRAWLMANGGWNSKGANDVEKIASDILARKRLKTVTSGGWRKNILDIWRKAAEEKK